MSAKASPPLRGRTMGQVVSAIGVVAAGVLAVLINVFAQRHYRRWDLTTAGLYTLSSATTETLRSLSDTVRIDVLLPTSDPVTSSVRLLLAEYQSKTSRLDVQYTDPDRRPADFLALQQKYGIEAGRTEDGQIIMDAGIVVSRPSSKPYFVSTADLFDFESGQEFRARSRMEQAFTLALRAIQVDERPLVCFTTGHGEIRLDDVGPQGLSEFVARLKKNNYDVESVDTSLPNARKSLDPCRVVMIVGPRQPFAPTDAGSIRSWFEAGGNLFILSGPEPDVDGKTLRPLGLNAVTSAAGIVFNEDFVFELEPSRKIPEASGQQFFAEPKAHEITMGLSGSRAAGDLRILMSAARSLSREGQGSVVPGELLVTSPVAFGMADPYGWIQKGGPPTAGPGDRKGPLTLAFASELIRTSGASTPSKGPRGPRMVVVGSASPALGQNWMEPILRGGAVFAESALSWLAARPPLVDLPEKPAVAGTRISEANLGEVSRYVLVYMPAAAALLGLSVYLRRRSTEGRPRTRASRAGN